jgi:hypothetical protein
VTSAQMRNRSGVSLGRPSPLIVRMKPKACSTLADL